MNIQTAKQLVTSLELLEIQHSMSGDNAAALEIAQVETDIVRHYTEWQDNKTLQEYNAIFNKYH